MLYKPAAVTPIGETAVLNTVAFVNGGDTGAAQPSGAGPGLPRTTPPAASSSPVNHLKSKGSACDAPDAGDGQGNCNVVRHHRGEGCWRHGWPATRRAPGTTTSLILGDLNSYAKEDPIRTLEEAASPTSSTS